jgi:hypothetical protein
VKDLESQILGLIATGKSLASMSVGIRFSALISYKSLNIHFIKYCRSLLSMIHG